MSAAARHLHFAMFKTLFSKLSAIAMAFTLALVTLLGAAATYIFRTHYINELKDELTRETNSINRIVVEEYLDTRNYAVANEKLLAISRQYGAAIQLIFSENSAMNVDIIDSQCLESWKIVELADVSAFAGRAMSSMETYGYQFNAFSGISDMKTLTITRHLQSGDGAELGVLLLHYDMTAINSTLSALYLDIFAAMLIALLIALIIAFIIARRITSPIESINRTVTEFAGGNYDARSSVALSDEVGRLAKSFNMMADVISDTERMRRDFVANVSHELRSPLTGIHAFLEAMDDGTIPPEEYHKYLPVLLEESNRMNSIINELLDISSIESGRSRLVRTDFDILELTGRTLLTFEGRIREKNADVCVELPGEPVYVNADEARIAQVLHNLIDNAVRFLPDSGGLLGIAASLDGRRVTVAISNNGVPISPEDLPHIFERFYKCEKARTRTSVSGTGLGLSIAQLIIEEHGGKILAESGELKTCFSFSLDTIGSGRPNARRKSAGGADLKQ